MAKRTSVKRERRAQIYLPNPLTNAQIKKLATNAKRGGPIDVVDRRDFVVEIPAPYEVASVSVAMSEWDALASEGWDGKEPAWETIRRACRRRTSYGTTVYHETVPIYRVLATFDGTNPSVLER